MCYIKNGKLKWEPQMDHYTEYYSYRLSGGHAILFQSVRNREDLLATN